jgi:transposase
MITFNRRTKVFVSKEPADMRASYDTLFSKAKSVFSEDPFSGHLFLFMNARRTSIKCLYYDSTGFVLLCKRMEKGLFCKINPYKKDIVLTEAEFALFFEGADLEKRFIDSPSEINFESRKQFKNKTFPVSQDLPSAPI